MTVVTLKAGPEMDAMVAEKVMGWTNEQLQWMQRDWSPSTDIGNAWEVLTKMRWKFTREYDWNRFAYGLGDRIVLGPASAPYEICFAALRAVGAIA